MFCGFMSHFFSPKFWTITTVPSGTVATIATFFFFFPVIDFVCVCVCVFFFPFKYLCKLIYILLYWYNKFHNIFTIIYVSISYKSKENNKRWDCDQSKLKINILRKCYHTYCAVLLIYSTGIIDTVPKVFFFSFKYLCKLVYMLLYWHNKFHNYWRVNFLQVEIK